MPNLYSLHDAFGFIFTAQLSVIFYILYWEFHKGEKIYLVFANMTACGALTCLFIYLSDNVIPAGVLPTTVKDANITSLWFSRFILLFSLGGGISLFHFVVIYSCNKGLMLKSLPWLYGFVFLASSTIFTPWFLTATNKSPTSYVGWLYAVPYWPDPGPLLHLVSIIWATLTTWAMIELWRNEGKHRHDNKTSLISHIAQIRLAFIAMGIGAFFDFTAVLFGYLGISVFPISQLIGSAIMSRVLIKNGIDQKKIEENARSSMKIAGKIQASMLPKTIPQLIGYDIAGWFKPAEAAGGDIYDAVLTNDHELLLLLADATGHGIGPALSVTQCRAMFRMGFRLESKSKKIYTSINNQVNADLPDGMFITAFFGSLDSQTHQIQYISAGQGPLVHIHTQQAKSTKLGASTLPLGIMDDPEINIPKPIQMQHQDIFAILSDGYFEYANNQNKQFGFDRVADTLLQNQHLSATDLIAKLNQTIKEFSQDAPQEDDMTALIIKRLPN